MLSKSNLLIIIALQGPAIAYAQKPAEVRSEAAGVRFQGANQFDNVYAASASTTGEFFGEPGEGNLTQLQASGTFIRSGAPSVHDSSEVISLERRASIGVSQTISQLSSIGLTGGYTSQTSSEGKTSLSRWYAARVGQWWNKATILTELEAMKTDSHQPLRSYLDTDGRRVLTPDRVQGNSYTLSLTWLASPQAMLLGNLARVYADNRPNANSATLEGRYFFNSSLTALHLKTGLYEDTSDVGRETDFGRISAREWETQVHQHINEQIIVAAVYRDHFETEKPRSSETTEKHRHSRMLQSRLRYRFVTGPVTDMVSEVYIFGGQYQSIDNIKAINHVGLGGVYVL